MTTNGTPCISGGYTNMMTNERTETRACDCISRQAAIDAIDKIFPADPMRNDYTQGITCGAALAEEYIKQLPSAQPERTDCTDCPEYDHEAHSCPKYCDVIRRTVEEAKQERTYTIDYVHHEGITKAEGKG